MKQYVVKWTVTAREDLEDIIAYFADDSPINALLVVKRIEARAQTLATMPERGRAMPELQWHGISTFLELTERPWRLIYRIDKLSVYVVGVLDGRRQFDDQLLNRFLRD